MVKMVAPRMTYVSDRQMNFSLWDQEFLSSVTTYWMSDFFPMTTKCYGTESKSIGKITAVKLLCNDFWPIEFEKKYRVAQKSVNLKNSLVLKGKLRFKFVIQSTE
jgi:hypothetical protein